MRNANTITQNESDIYTSFCVTNGIVLEGEPGIKNAQAFLNTLNGPITLESLRFVFSQLQPQGSLTFLSPVEAEFNRLKSQLTDEQSSIILYSLGYLSLENHGEAQLVNFNEIANWLIQNNQPITLETITNKIGIIRGQRGSQLRWRRKLQDFEKRAIEERDQRLKEHEEYIRTHPGKNPDELTRPDGVGAIPGHLKAHADMLHRSTTQPETPVQQTPKTFWQSYVEGRLAHDLRTSADREQAQQLIQDDINQGTWKDAARRLDGFIERKRAGVI
jgi:hypothetical protein